jgi:hypothetical protein
MSNALQRPPPQRTARTPERDPGASGGQRHALANGLCRLKDIFRRFAMVLLDVRSGKRQVGAFKRLGQHLGILVTRDVDGAEALQVFGGELGVEQHEAAFTQFLDKMN